VGDDMRRDIDDRMAGEWVLLAQPVSVRQGNAFGDFGAQCVPVVNCHRGDRTVAPLQRPPNVGQFPSPPCLEEKQLIYVRVAN